MHVRKEDKLLDGVYPIFVNLDTQVEFPSARFFCSPRETPSYLYVGDSLRGCSFVSFEDCTLSLAFFKWLSTWIRSKNFYFTNPDELFVQICIFIFLKHIMHSQCHNRGMSSTLISWKFYLIMTWIFREIVNELYVSAISNCTCNIWSFCNFCTFFKLPNLTLKSVHQFW